jgi:putative nucleotidyltransferase with HDIG domain
MKVLGSLSSRDAGRVRTTGPRAPWWSAPDPAPDVARSVPELTDDEHMICLRLGRRVTQGDFQVPSIPVVAAEAVALLDQPNPESQQISRLIARDQQLAADVVSFANSALFAGVMKVSNIPQAVARVGFKRTRNLILASSLRGLIYGKCELAIAENLWRHSIGCAMIAARIARNWRCHPDDAYLAGLFHDVGKTVVLALINGAVLKSKGSALRTEFVQHTLDLYHEGVGVAVTTQWKLPEHVVEAIRRHTETESVKLTRPQAIVALANNVCHRLKVGETDDGRPIAAPVTLEALGATESDLPQLLEGVKEVLDPA